MTTEELRACADQAEQYLLSLGDPCDGDDWALMQVVRAWKAANPEDDDAPTDEKYVRLIAENSLPKEPKEGEAVWHWMPHEPAMNAVFLRCDENGIWTANVHAHYWPDGPTWNTIAEVPTRGHIRRLLAAVGSPLGGRS